MSGAPPAHRRRRDLPAREQAIRRTFGRYVAAGVIRDDEYHAFCHWMRDHTEAGMLRALEDARDRRALRARFLPVKRAHRAS